MWTDGAGFFYIGDCRPGDRAATSAEVSAYQASVAPPPTFTFLQFLGLFATGEQAAIVQSTDVQVKLFVLKAAGASFVSLADPETKAGLDYLVSIGLLTQAREAAILAAPAPSTS